MHVWAMQPSHLKLASNNCNSDPGDLAGASHFGEVAMSYTKDTVKPVVKDTP